MQSNNEIGDLTQIMADIRDYLAQLVNFEKEQEEISFIPRKDIKSILNCSDVTVAKMFNRDDFPAIMIGEHKIEKTALKKWLQERRV